MEAASSQAKRKPRDLSQIPHCVRTLYDPGQDDATLDVIAVPGLGADPFECWRSKTRGGDGKDGFHWLQDADGLRQDFPHARIMLYEYASAWRGKFKVNAYLSNIAISLLERLTDAREDCPHRPIVFIGHSLGGLVIAEAVCTSNIIPYKARFPQVFECIAGCLFLGTPFGGSRAAKLAGKWAQATKFYDPTVESELLGLLEPGNQRLKKLRHDCALAVSDQVLQPGIRVFCFFERDPMDSVKGFWIPLFQELPQAHFVLREDALLAEGHLNQELACNHQDLSRFSSCKDERLVSVRGQLKYMIQRANVLVKQRLSSSGQISPVVDNATFKTVTRLLEGPYLHTVRPRGTVLGGPAPERSWILGEPEYQRWLKPVQGTQKIDHLWISGRDDQAELDAAAGAFRESEAISGAAARGERQVLVGYFCFDSTPGTNHAENMLKSVLWQLIQASRDLAQYAKRFMKSAPTKTGDRDRDRDGDDEVEDASSTAEASTAKPTEPPMTVENLWKSLVDMAEDTTVAKVYLIVCNMHHLSPDYQSNKRLLELIQQHVSAPDPFPSNDSGRIKWLFGSLQNQQLGNFLLGPRTFHINLDDNKYDEKRRTARASHVQQRLGQLASKKSYDRALRYLCMKLMLRKAESNVWADIVLRQLLLLPSQYARVRKELERSPQNLDALLTMMWRERLQSTAQNIETIKEMLRVLLVVYEKPTLEELALLIDCSSENKQTPTVIRSLVAQCMPLVTLQRGVHQEGSLGLRVAFANSEIKEHLLKHTNELLDTTEEGLQWQHGIVALRCFQHIYQLLTQDEGADDLEEAETIEPVDEAFFQDAALEASSDGALDPGDELDGMPGMMYGTAAGDFPPGTDYLVKYWLLHASEATHDIADELYRQRDFWSLGSKPRERWLRRYNELTDTFADMNLEGMTAVHVAAAIGFPQLLTVLVEQKHDGEVFNKDGFSYRPLHLAAHFGRKDMVPVLLDQMSFKVNDGTEERSDTPLHMAARAGHLQVMELLLGRDADPNATSDNHGTPLSAAIMSGKIEVVRLLLDQGVNLTTKPGDESCPPLVVACTLCGLDTVEALLEMDEKDQTMSKDYGDALAAAALAGHASIVTKLLNNIHEGESLQHALDNAAEGRHWEIVKQLLESYDDLACDRAFYQAARDPHATDDLLKVMWASSGEKISQMTRNDALYIATDLEKETTVKLLLSTFGADANARGPKYGNALTAAAHDGTEPIVKLLLKYAAKPNTPFGWPLQAAAAQGHLKIVKLLLKHKAKVNEPCHHFYAVTALQAAVEGGHDEIVRLLLEQPGADANAGGGYYGYPIIAATMRHEQHNILELLVRHDADTDITGGPQKSTPLCNAVLRMPLRSVQHLVDAGADVDYPNGNGDTPLILAVGNGDIECVGTLLKADADVDHVSPVNGTALHLAAYSGSVECCKLLLDRGADPTTVGGQYYTILQAAALSGNPGCLQLILEQGVQVDEQGGLYHCALQAAATVSMQCVRMLLDQGGQVDIKPGGVHGTTLLAAAANGQDEIVRVLLEEGGDPRMVVDGQYRSALHAAVLRCSYSTCAQVLESLGSDASLKSGSSEAILDTAQQPSHSQLVVEAARRTDDDGQHIVELLLSHAVSLNATVMREIMQAAAECGNIETIYVAQKFNTKEYMPKPLMKDRVDRFVAKARQARVSTRTAEPSASRVEETPATEVGDPLPSLDKLPLHSSARRSTPTEAVDGASIILEEDGHGQTPISPMQSTRPSVVSPVFSSSDDIIDPEPGLDDPLEPVHVMAAQTQARETKQSHRQKLVSALSSTKVATPSLPQFRRRPLPQVYQPANQQEKSNVPGDRAHTQLETRSTHLDDFDRPRSSLDLRDNASVQQASWSSRHLGRKGAELGRVAAMSMSSTKLAALPLSRWKPRSSPREETDPSSSSSQLHNESITQLDQPRDQEDVLPTPRLAGPASQMNGSSYERSSLSSVDAISVERSDWSSDRVTEGKNRFKNVFGKK